MFFDVYLIEQNKEHIKFIMSEKQWSKFYALFKWIWEGEIVNQWHTQEELKWIKMS